jgi:hypothetical protein
MLSALGIWLATLGYALVYTGVQFFTSGGGSLAVNLGLTPPSPGSAAQLIPSTGYTQAQEAAYSQGGQAASDLYFYTPSTAPTTGGSQTA